MERNEWYGMDQEYSQGVGENMDNQKIAYTGNRCARCNHKLGDPSKVYGAYCASRLGVTEYGTIAAAKVANEEKGTTLLTEKSLQLYNNFLYGFVKAPDYDELMYDTIKLENYINALGGINRSEKNRNTYQVIYGAWDRPPIKDDAPNLSDIIGFANRYNNYSFTEMDAMNWLIQTGGKTNFVLQYRDAQNMRDSENNFDDWKVKDESAAWQIDVIHKFINAAERLNDYGLEVELPKFYVGAAENYPRTLVSLKMDLKNGKYVHDPDGHPGIYEQVLENLGSYRGAVAGVYYGEDGVDEEYAQGVSSWVHNEQGGQLLWIPFFRLGGGDNQGDVNADGFFTRVENVAEKCDYLGRPLFNTVIFQPGTFFYEDTKGLNRNEFMKLAYKVSEWNAWNSNLGLNSNDVTRCKMGIEMEFDMSAITGRDDEDYSVRNTEKHKKILDSLDIVKRLPSDTPIGVYSGGPNEQGYQNPFKNVNRHNTGNYRVQDSWRNYQVGNGKSFDSFPGAYGRNFIYEMNDYIYRDLRDGEEINNDLRTFLTE